MSNPIYFIFLIFASIPNQSNGAELQSRHPAGSFTFKKLCTAAHLDLPNQ